MRVLLQLARNLNLNSIRDLGAFQSHSSVARVFEHTSRNLPKPTPEGCDRLGEANPTITQATRDREASESLGQKWGLRGPSV